MNKQSYDRCAAEKLEDWIMEKTRNNKGLSNTAMHIYTHGMPRLEKKKTGLCQATTATYREIAKYSYVSFQSVKPALDLLNGRLC